MGGPESLTDHGPGERPGGWRAALDRGMPWLLAAWALLQLLVLFLDGPLGLDDGRGFAPALLTLALVWSLLGGTAFVLAVRNAWASRAMARVAWSVVVAALAVTAPVALAFLSTGHEEDPSQRCHRSGIVPWQATEALIGWIPWAIYPWVAAGLGVAGAGLLFGRTTARPGAWVLATLAASASLFLVGFGLLVNNCPD